MLGISAARSSCRAGDGLAAANILKALERSGIQLLVPRICREAEAGHLTVNTLWFSYLFDGAHFERIADIMIIGERIKTLRQQKGFSQGDIEKRTNMLRCYISRVENGHTVPSLETLERFARALEVPLHELFYEGDQIPAATPLSADEVALSPAGDSIGRLARLFARLGHDDRQFLLKTAERLGKL